MTVLAGIPLAIITPRRWIRLEVIGIGTGKFVALHAVIGGLDSEFILQTR